MRIVWTKIEKQQVSDCMVKLLEDRPAMTNKQVFGAARQALPYERRGRVTDQRVFSYKALIKAARAAADKFTAERKTQAGFGLQAAAKPVEPPKQVPAPEPTPAVRKLDTLGEVFELFVDALADRIIQRLEARAPKTEPIGSREHKLEDLFGGDPMEQLDKVFDSLYPASKRAPTQPRKPTVLVIGLNGHQMECIKQSRPDLDYTFVTAEQALSHTTLNKDHTILMTKFINHSAQAKYRKHPNLHYCNGGVSDLKHMLQVIFHKEAA
jgi:hypothetical protein